MGPKKGKDNTSDENYWRKCIEQAPLDEEHWKVKVVMFEAAGSDQDRIYLNKFEIFATEEKRFVIKNICKTETIFMVNQLGGEKKVKDDNLRVFEEGQAYLKDKKDIPPEILALIIKHLILKMKEEYLFIKRQRLQVKEGMRTESATMLERTEVRGTVASSRTPEPMEPLPSPKAKGKNNIDTDILLPMPDEGKKYNTQLRIRGEEWRDKVYVDDYPTDGPNIYVALTGFVDPHLPACLLKIGIPLTAVVQIRIDASTTKIPSTLFRATKRGQSQTELLAEKSNQFWEDLQTLRIQKHTADFFKNTAFIIFSPPYWDFEKLSGNPDKIYDEVCYLMYDIQDLSRQHGHYLENMDIINIPNEEKIDSSVLEKYQEMIDWIPLECVTIYSVLDSVLQIVVRGLRTSQNISRTTLSTPATINASLKNSPQNEKEAQAETLVKDVFNSLCQTDAFKKSYRITYGEEYENHKDPIVINYGDIAKYNTFHLGNINLNNIVWSMLLGMPIHNLWKNQPKPAGELEAKINFHVTVLLSCFDREDVETNEMSRLIHILACRKLYNNRSSLKKQHLVSTTVSEFKKIYLKRSILAEPLKKYPSSLHSCNPASPSFPSMTKSENISNISYGDDSETERIKFLFDCPDISELVSAAEISNGKPMSHMIDDFDYFEDFTGTSAFQIMLETFNNYNCVDFKYCEVTDCIILMFFNSHDNDGIAREEWRCHLSTPLCLEDFFDFVLEEHYDWIQNEEKIYNERMVLKSQSEFKVFIDPFALKSCIHDNEVDCDLLMEGSLKYQEIQRIEESVEVDTEILDSKISSSKKTASSTTTETDTKSTKKSKPPGNNGPKTQRHSFLADEMDVVADMKKPFSGYDLGDRRVEVFGKDANYFSKDGTQVSSKYTLTIPTNLEYIDLRLLPGNSYNEFWFHRAIGDSITPEIIDTCQSVRISSKDQVMIYLKKQTYINLLPLTLFSGTDVKKMSSNKTSNVILPQILETNTFHSLFITWPNGQITESVHEINSPTISHIKQYYVRSLSYLKEDMRCITLNGEVIVFKTTGDIEVFKSDGTYIVIKKCEKKECNIDNLDDILSESSSSKKSKAKDKQKPTSKSSKSDGSDDEQVHKKKTVEAELVIEEFEIIESNGIRQKWTNDVPTVIEKLLIRTATDYCLGEIFSRRMDGTSILLNKDGVQVVTFPDTTRIISYSIIEKEYIYPEWTDEEKEYFDLVELDTVKSKTSTSQKSYSGYNSIDGSLNSKITEEQEAHEKERTDGYVSVQLMYTIENKYFTTVTIDKTNGKIAVDSPNGCTVGFNSINNNYDIKLDDLTSATFDGQNLHVSYEACPECKSFTYCDVNIKPNDDCSVTNIQRTWLKLKDSFGTTISVNEEGEMNLVNESSSAQILNNEENNLPKGREDIKEVAGLVDEKSDGKSESSVLMHGKCREMYMARAIRFFVLKRELTCTELVHRALLDQYKKACRWQPWCSINQYDTFGDHRSLLSMLTPVHLTETEKWLMESKLANKPKYLTFKDLKKDSGKGFYHWMRPYERFVPVPRKPDNVLQERLPKAFILRTLELQWKESEREELKGAKELLKAILRYRSVMESDSATILHVPILDPRPEDERQIDDIVQALAHRLYEDLKKRLAEDVEARAKATITTKPPKVTEEMSVEGELEEEIDHERCLEEERRSSIKQVEAVEQTSPNLSRYWRRRAEELKEEQFYKYLLREGSVPPYFRNVLGGAIWWEMNNTTDEAVTKAERRKMKCVCADEEATHGSGEGYSFTPPVFL